MADTNLTKLDIYEKTLSTMNTSTMDNNAQYIIKDMPLGGITNAQMLLALEPTKQGIFLVGSVYMCTDTVSGQYTANHFYKLTDTPTWEDVTPSSTPTKEDIIRNLPPFKSTIQLSVSSISTAYTFPIVSSTNFAVDWGDGTFESFSTATTSLTHTFSTTGIIYVNFYGEWKGIHYTSSSDTSKNLIYGAWYDKNIIEVPSYAFYSCVNLTVFEYKASVLNIGSYAFRSINGNLAKIDFNRVGSIGSYAFDYQSNRIGGVLEFTYNSTNGINIDSHAFGHSNIQILKLNASLETGSPLRYGSNYNFEASYQLSKVVCNGNYRITSYCFNGCTRLHTIIIEKPLYYNSDYNIMTLSGSLGSNLPSDLVILVPYSQLQAYKTGTNWTTYANQIYPIGGQYTETVTIASTDWTLNSTTNLYEATATVVGATNESRNILDWSLVDSNGNQIEDTYGLGASAQGSMSITFTAQTVPTSSIYISVQSTLTNYVE